MSSTWDSYAEAARQLDAVRAIENARTAGIRTAVIEMSDHAGQLDQQLQEQRGKLTELGRTLNLRIPKLEPISPAEPVTEPAPALNGVATAISRVDRLATSAADRARYPALLPRWPAFARNLLIYAIAAAGVLIAQVAQFWDLLHDERAPEPNPVVVLGVLPSLGFLAGYLVATIGGRARVSDRKPAAHWQLGALLCFFAGPVAIASLLFT